MGIVGGSGRWNGLDFSDPAALSGAIVVQGSETRKSAAGRHAYRCGAPGSLPSAHGNLGGTLEMRSVIEETSRPAFESWQSTIFSRIAALADQALGLDQLELCLNIAGTGGMTAQPSAPAEASKMNPPGVR